MDPVENPYSPGAGRQPAALVGRDSELTTWGIALRRIEVGRDAQPLVLYGLRGVGKTVLLHHLAQIARQRDWIVAQVESMAGSTIRDAVGDAFHREISDLLRPNAGARVLKALKTMLSFKATYDASSGTWAFGLDLSGSPGGGADSGELEADLDRLLRDLSSLAEEEHVGVALLIDEAQDLDLEELAALCAIVHAANQRGERLTIALAGLPSLPSKLSEAKSYAERLFAYHAIGPLDDVAARAAIVEPARDTAVEWNDDAVAHVLEKTAGYPYFVQQYGQDTWNFADSSPITATDAKGGIATGQLALDTGFFRARWDRATKAEKDYLRAMAADGDNGSASGDVASRLGKRVTSLGPTRAKLIQKGLIYAPVHGVVAFTVPAMAAFVHRQHEGA